MQWICHQIQMNSNNSYAVRLRKVHYRYRINIILVGLTLEFQTGKKYLNEKYKDVASSQSFVNLINIIVSPFARVV